MRRTVSLFRQGISFSVLCSFLSSIPIALIPMAKVNDSNRALDMLIPIVFWLGLIGEQFFIWRANYYRKVLEKKNERYPKRIRGRPGAFSVFRTTEGIVCDLLFLLSLTVFIVIALKNKGEGVLQYILIGFMVLSFRLHCTFNGINYRYKKLLTEVGKRDVQHGKKANV